MISAMLALPVLAAGPNETRPPSCTALALSTGRCAAAVKGTRALVFDGADGGDCTVGLGSSSNICIYDGAAWVLTAPINHQECRTIENLRSDDDNKPFWMHSAHSGGITLVSASCICIGTCTVEADILWEVDDGSQATLTGTTTCEDITTGDTNIAFSGAETAFAQYEVLIMNVNNTPTLGDDYIICVNWTQ